VEALLARRWWPLAVGVLLGVAVGLIVSLVGSTSRRAEASVLISSPRGNAAVRPLLPNLRELATSSVVAGNVRSTLRLEDSAESIRGHLHSSVRPQSEVIVLAATDGNADKARQLAQEAAVVFAQLVDVRFGTATPPLHAAVFDAAHVLSATDRHFLRNVLIGALVGLILGAGAISLLDRGEGVATAAPSAGVSPEAAADLRRREQSLEQRLEQVTARERELARRAGELAARQRELEERDAPEPEPEPPEPAPEPEPEPPPVPAEPTPAPEPVEAAPAVPSSGRWNLQDLVRLFEENSDASTEQAEEWRTYLFFLRGHAAADGSLPAQFDGLVNDVFGDLLR
jgi:hypothetical protein